MNPTMKAINVKNKKLREEFINTSIRIPKEKFEDDFEDEFYYEEPPRYTGNLEKVGDQTPVLEYIKQKENNENVGKLAKNLTTNIENGTILRKSPSTSIDYYDEQVEELCLYRYKRYLGSLRCLLDTLNMRKAIQGEEVVGKSTIKSLIKRKNIK